MNAKEFLDLQDAYVEVCEQETGRGPRISDTYDERDAEGGPPGGGRIRGPKRRNVIRIKREEVENWVNSLIEEGYDLSEYTWDEMSEIYLNEVTAMAKRGLDELWKGRHGQSDAEYQAGRSDAGKRISGDANTGPRYYTLGRSRGAKPDAPTSPGARPVNSPKMSSPEKEYHQYNKSDSKRRTAAGYNKVGGSRGLPEEVDTFDAILEHLVAEGYADTNENALAIMANMSEEWREDIMEEAKDQSDKQIEKGVKTTYKAQNVLDNQHQGRSKGLNKLPRGEREEKAKRMSGRLKTRRDDLFGERNKREDESRAELKKKYGL